MHTTLAIKNQYYLWLLTIKYIEQRIPMINPIIFGFILMFLAIGWFCISVYVAQTIKTINDYFLAGKILGTIPVTLTLLATQIGANFLSGVAQQSYNLGYYGLLYALATSFGFIILSLGIARQLKLLSIATTAQIFEVKYKSVLLKKIASLFSMASLWGILVVQIVTLNSITTTLGITNQWYALFFWLIIVINTVTGGLGSVVIVDIIKQSFIIGTFLGIFLYSFLTNVHSLSHLSYLVEIQQFFTPEQISWQHLISTCVISSFFCLIQQDIAQCFFAARTASIAARSALYATCFLLFFCWMPVYFGMQAKLFGALYSYEVNPLALFLQNIAGSAIFLLIIIGIVAAITSSASSLLCAISSNIVQDFQLAKHYTNTIFLSKTITLLAGLTGIFIAFAAPTIIITALSQSYKLYVSALFIPSIAGYLRSNVQIEQAWGAFLGGIIGFFVFNFFPLFINQLMPLLCSLIGYMAGSYTKPFKQLFANA